MKRVSEGAKLYKYPASNQAIAGLLSFDERNERLPYLQGRIENILLYSEPCHTRHWRHKEAQKRSALIWDTFGNVF